MLGTKLNLAAILATVGMLTISGFVSSSASAATVLFTLTSLKCEGGTSRIFCYEEATQLLELLGEEEFSTTILGGGSTATLRTSIGGQAVEIKCKGVRASRGANTANGLITQTTPLGINYLLSVVLTFTTCSLEGAIGTKCRVPTERSTKELDGEPLSAEDVDFSPLVGGVIMEIPFENINNCPVVLLGVRNVTGVQLCSWENPGTDEITKFLECGNSELLLAEQPAELKVTVTVSQVNLGDKWDLVEVG